jgi:hypothetical protein
LQEKKENIVKSINVETLKEFSKNSKIIFLKPIEIKKQINIREIINFSKTEII